MKEQNLSDCNFTYNFVYLYVIQDKTMFKLYSPLYFFYLVSRKFWSLHYSMAKDFLCHGWDLIAVICRCARGLVSQLVKHPPCQSKAQGLSSSQAAPFWYPEKLIYILYHLCSCIKWMLVSWMLLSEACERLLRNNPCKTIIVLEYMVSGISQVSHFNYIYIKK